MPRTPILGRGQRKERRLRQGVERQGKQCADQRNQRRMRDVTQAPQPAAFQADRQHHLIGTRAQYSRQIEGTQRHQKRNRDQTPQQTKPFRHLPLTGQCRDAEGNRHDHHTMPQREQTAAIAGQRRTLPGIEAGQSVDGREMIGIEAVLHAEHKSQDHQRQEIGRQRIHGTRKMVLHILIQLACGGNKSLFVLTRLKREKRKRSLIPNRHWLQGCLHPLAGGMPDLAGFSGRPQTGRSTSA